MKIAKFTFIQLPVPDTGSTFSGKTVILHLNHIFINLESQLLVISPLKTARKIN